MSNRVEDMKTKEAGDIKNTKKIIANGIQFLNGEECTRHYKIPIILLDYESPESSHSYAKGERFALWCKLEEADYKKVVSQLNRSLRELTIWFDEENLEDLRRILNEHDRRKKEQQETKDERE